jgi:hypothetical protein
MKVTLTKSMFRDEFKICGLSDQFSYEALGALFDYFEECNPDMEFDPAEICGNYSESTFEQVVIDYKLDDDDDEGAETVAMRYLEHHTLIVAVLDDSVVFCTDF